MEKMEMVVDLRNWRRGWWVLVVAMVKLKESEVVLGGLGGGYGGVEVNGGSCEGGGEI